MLQDNKNNQAANKERHSLGEDKDEQKMNGLYGMIETPEEDALPEEK